MTAVKFGWELKSLDDYRSDWMVAENIGWLPKSLTLNQNSCTTVKSGDDSRNIWMVNEKIGWYLKSSDGSRKVLTGTEKFE